MCAQINYDVGMAKETTINVRIDEETKRKAAEIFARCGYTTSNAVRLFLLRAIKEDDWPFEIHNFENAQLDDLGPLHGPVATLEELFAELNTPDEDELEEELVQSKTKRASKKNARG